MMLFEDLLFCIRLPPRAVSSSIRSFLLRQLASVLAAVELEVAFVVVVPFVQATRERERET